MRRTAVGIAESADVNVQLSKSANEGAPVHSQHSGGFALMGILAPAVVRFLQDPASPLPLKRHEARFGGSASEVVKAEKASSEAG